VEAGAVPVVAGLGAAEVVVGLGVAETVLHATQHIATAAARPYIRRPVKDSLTRDGAVEWFTGDVLVDG
jgi:hypothetical protein